MTQGFDEYWDKENVRFDDSYHKHKETYDLGAASRQAEIDELQKRLAMYERQGYKLVPINPTEEMIDAGVEESDVDWKRLKFAYQAMIGEETK